MAVASSSRRSGASTDTPMDDPSFSGASLRVAGSGESGVIVTPRR
jgi:hypothetical protein